MRQQAKYDIGEVVAHLKHGYRALIVDIDPIFQPSGYKKHRQQADNLSKEASMPWYRLLVDDSSHITYVEESLLKPMKGDAMVENPNVKHYLQTNTEGYSLPQQQIN